MSDISGLDAASDLLAMMSFDGGYVTIDGRELFLWQQGMKLLVDEVVPDDKGFTTRGQLLVAPVPEFLDRDTRTGWYFQLGDDVQWELGDFVALRDDPAPNDLPGDPDPDPEPPGQPDYGPMMMDEQIVPRVRRTHVPAKTIAINLRLAPDLVGRLGDAARERMLGRNLLIERLLERALADLPPIDL